MTAFINKHIFSNANKNEFAPHIFGILVIYTLIVSTYTGLFFGTQSMLVRFGISALIVVAYIALERSPLSSAVTSLAVPLFCYAALTAGAIYFKGDFLIFSYSCCLAMISFTYLNPKALLTYLISSSAVSAIILLLLDINLLGPVFSKVYNILYLLVSVGLNYLIYTFCKIYVKSLQNLLEAKNEANAANQAKSAFLSTMSHEIRTPLNAILGITEIQLQKDTLDPQEKEALDKVYASGDLLLGIINDILDLSKIEAGKLELIIAEYEIASLISDTAQLNIMRIGSKPITFDLAVDENLPVRLSGDELRVKQILNNLLSNAFKYTSEGTVKLSVSAENGGNEAVLAIVVSDTGQGMTKEQVDKLFDEYTRFNMEANRTTEGTGLGMSITNNLINMMDGGISVDSEPGKGSTFTVRLPQGRVCSEVIGLELAESLQRFHTNSASHLDKLHVDRDYMPYGSVLIVDDIETNIYVARGLMSPYGLTIDSAGSGAEAIEKIKEGNVYDIVFMDHMMPVMDGMETTEVIRGMGYDHAIVALTANAVAGQSELFLRNGFDSFISKPIELHQLDDVLNKLIRDKQPLEIIEAARKEAGHSRPAEDAGAQTVDPRFSEVFVSDAVKSIAALESINEKQGTYDDSDIRTYVIHVHGMKSALANIGESELSAVAAGLEAFGRKNNTISPETPEFLSALRDVVEKLAPKDEYVEDVEEDLEYLNEKLLAVQEACRAYDQNTADDILAEVRKKSWSPQTNELLHTISEALLHSEFDEIANATY